VDEEPAGVEEPDGEDAEDDDEDEVEEDSEDPPVDVEAPLVDSLDDEPEAFEPLPLEPDARESVL
jgi:hypothetical protein